MAKRFRPSQRNTLCNYFQLSPKGEKPKVVAPDATKDNVSDDEVVFSSKKQRCSIIILSSDSDSENIEVPSQKKDDSGKASFSKSSASSSEPPEEKISVATTTKSITKTIDDDKVKWAHEKLSFLKPENIRDIYMIMANHPDYDARTLNVPNEYLKSLTPAMRQWWELKCRHMDSVLFFKVGKFYELYHMDAVIGVKHLRLSYKKGDFANSEFPESVYGEMAASLIEKGYKVARVEQTETSRKVAERCKLKKKATKFDKVMKREICQITSKGTLTYTAQLTDAKQPLACYMIAICEKVKDNIKRFGVCFIETSIGIFYVGEFDDDGHCSRLLSLLAQHPPALVLTEKRCMSNETSETLNKHLENVRWDTLAAGKQFYSADMTIDKLTTACYFKNENNDLQWPDGLVDLMSDGCPKPEYELALKSLGACLWYLKDSVLDIQIFSMGKFVIYSPIDTVKSIKSVPRDHMVLDSITMNNLKILGGPGTLQTTVDHCVTPFGKRLLQQWICRPLCDVVDIQERQNAVQELLNYPEKLRATREFMSKLPDFERQIAKIHTFGNKFCSTLHPDSRVMLYEQKIYTNRKVVELLKTLEALQMCMQIPNVFKDCEAKLLRKITQFKPSGMFEDLSGTFELFKNAFDNYKAKRDGIVIPRIGVDREYDDNQSLIKSIQNQLDDFLKAEKKFFKCDELSAKMIKAEKERNKILKEFNRKLFEKFSAHREQWEQVMQSVMMLDCLCSFAEYARTYSKDICVPNVIPFSDMPISRIEKGRHPCITNVDNSVPNDSEFGTDGHGNILILTIPNMGGKSTLMRQIALISIMAQIGCHVPALSCEMSLIDRIFTCFGAHDNIFKNQSAFLVQLSEASSILQQATRNSFILIDELGRGTSAHDGNAIATDYILKLCEINCRTIFSTHCHTLVEHICGKNNIQHKFMIFITLMDKLRLEIRAKDNLHPELRDLLDTMNRVSILPSDFEGKQKVTEWLATLNSMQASNELSDAQVRQLLFDLESLYSAFNKVLHNTS